MTAAISQPADPNITRSAQYCYVQSLYQDIAGQTYTDIVDGGILKAILFYIYRERLVNTAGA